MKVTHFQTCQAGKSTILSADFIFSRPVGGRKSKLRSYIAILRNVLFNPIEAAHSGLAVKKTIWFKIPTKVLVSSTVEDAFFLLALPLAIATNEDLDFDGDVSEELHRKTRQVEHYYSEILKKDCNVLTKKRSLKREENQGKGLFFTLGVDSFYSLLLQEKSRAGLPDFLLYVDGYDIPLKRKALLRQVHKRIALVSKKTKMSPVFVETNLREFSDEVIGWGRFHFSALAAVGTMLKMRKILVSGESFNTQDWGTRIGADTLYSSRNKKFKLIGHDILRYQKIQRLLNSHLQDIFLKNVRVCWENVRLVKNIYNCSSCQKCLKTQITLLSLGKTSQPTFSKLDIQKISKIQLNFHVYDEWKELYKQVKKSITVPPQILSAMEQLLRKQLRN